MPKYLIDPRRKSYQVLDDIQDIEVSLMKGYGINIYHTSVLPGDLKEDPKLIYRLRDERGMIILLESIRRKIKRVLRSNSKGVCIGRHLYDGEFKYDLIPTDELDLHTLVTQCLESNILITQVFPLPDENIEEKIIAHLEEMLEKCVKPESQE